MINLVCQNSGNVWLSGETVQAAVEKVGEIGASDYAYFDVSEYDRRNSVEAKRRWYFSVYKSDDEFTADDAEELAEGGEFLGYIALVERDRAE
ncbi:hypothetical protein [Ciceribacter selenitireducens]|uniref:Uncharacterized protein n=1 Tax=Ciceribacter selenitireducens ATCC BAA-1503 TaxID=1336235 RepID=A0A376A9V9_9HYPH|nr:hypothetical protein [Ciceribacter selenitireducens]SSC64528.1 unnamed protein product [Ciceribacter selenitireducens ATCC BAA-1503]